MKYRIHYTVGEHEYSFVVTGETVEDIQAAAEYELAARGLGDVEKNDAWSEEEK